MVRLLEYNLPSYASCSGTFTVEVDGEKWFFGGGALITGGNVSFDENWSEHVEEGPWRIGIWPEDFPEDKKWEVLEAINEEIPWGCCGGCV